MSDPNTVAYETLLSILTSDTWSYDSIQSKVAPLLQKAKRARTSGDMEGSWSCNNAKLNATLPQETWFKTASYFASKSDFSFDEASAQMQSVTLSHPRRDFRDRVMLRLSPSWRLAQLKFRKVGVLIPFSASSEEFIVSNS